MIHSTYILETGFVSCSQGVLRILRPLLLTVVSIGAMAELPQPIAGLSTYNLEQRQLAKLGLTPEVESPLPTLDQRSW